MDIPMGEIPKRLPFRVTSSAAGAGLVSVGLVSVGLVSVGLVGVAEGSEKVFGRLADLPISIFEGSFEGGVDVGPVEWGERDDGASTHRGLVVERSEDGGLPRMQRTEGGDGRFSSQGVVVGERLVFQCGDDLGIGDLEFAEDERGQFGEVGVVAEEGLHPGSELWTTEVACGEFERSALHDRGGIVEGLGQHGDAQPIHPEQGAQCSGSQTRIVVIGSGFDGLDVVAMAGDDHATKIDQSRGWVVIGH